NPPSYLPAECLASARRHPLASSSLSSCRGASWLAPRYFLAARSSPGAGDVFAVFRAAAASRAPTGRAEVVFRRRTDEPPSPPPRPIGGNQRPVRWWFSGGKPMNPSSFAAESKHPTAEQNTHPDAVLATCSYLTPTAALSAEPPAAGPVPE